MRVICPSCGFDAGDIPEVQIGCNVQCDCGYKWTYQGLLGARSSGQSNHSLGGQSARLAKTILKTSGALAAAGFRKLRSHVEKKIFSKNLPDLFLQAASDGVVSEEEEANLRAALSQHGVSWAEAVGQIKPLTREFVRRVLADVVADWQITAAERTELARYIQLFNLEDMREEVASTLDRVETIWKLNNGILPSPVTDKPLWLHSDEAVYFRCDAQYLRQMKQEYRRVAGELFATNTRVEFISPDFTISHNYEQLRRCDPARRTHLSLLFHPKRGSGTYIVPDAPLAAAYLNALARSANRTITISREDSTVQERRRIPKEVRHEVWIRDGGKCVECGAEDYIEFDHIIPVTRGGSNTANNIQLLCRRCNGRKSDQI